MILSAQLVARMCSAAAHVCPHSSTGPQPPAAEAHPLSWQCGAKVTSCLFTGLAMHHCHAPHAACQLTAHYAAPPFSRSPLALLSADISVVVKAASKQLSEKYVKTKVGVFGVLRELVAVLPAGVAEHVATLVPGILHALNVRGAACCSAP